MKKILAFAFALLTGVPAFAGTGGYDPTTYLYSGTKQGETFQQYCYTNGFLCVLTDVAQQVVEPAELVLRRAGVTNVYTNVQCPLGQALDGWVMDVKTAKTISAFPPERLEDVVPATNYTGSVVSIPGANVTFARWDRYLLLIPCFSWLEYDLIYEANDGSGSFRRDQDSVHLSTDEVTVAENPWKRMGYDFLGWARTPEGAAEIEPGACTTGIALGAVTNGPFRLYAVWRKVDMTVSLDACGGTVSVGSVIARIDEDWSLPTPVREDCTFSGWFTHESGGVQIRDGERVSRTDITTLYAHWELERHSVRVGTFTPRFGTVTPSGEQKVEHGKALSLRATPEPGFGFVGWNDGSSAPERTVIVSSNALYWARFAQKTHTVTFVYRTATGERAEETQTVADGACAWPPASTVCKQWKGHPFVRWGGDSYTSVTGDRIVTAEYGNATSTVYFLPNGGAGRMVPQEVAAGQMAVLRANAYTLTNATFVGWATAADATTNDVLYADCAVVTDPAPEGYLALYAVWQPTPVAEPDPGTGDDAGSGTGSGSGEDSGSGSGEGEESGSDSESLADPVALELTSDVWEKNEEGVWYDDGLNLAGYPDLSGSVTGSGTLTFSWMAQNLYIGGTNDTAITCVLETNDVPAVELQTDSTWHDEVLIIQAAEDVKTVLTWRRKTEYATYVSNVVWQARRPAEPDPDPIPDPEPEPDPIPNPEQAFYHVFTDTTYDGQVKTGVVAIAGCTLSGQVATGAGSYQAVASLNSGAIWGDGGTERNRIVTWGIARGVYDMSAIRFTNETVVADGTPKRLQISGTLPAGVTVSYTGNGASVCGDYDVEASFTGDAENFEEIDPLQATLSIVSPFGSAGTYEPVTTELPLGALSAFDVTAAYDGRPHGLDVTALAAAFGSTAADPLTVRYAAEDSPIERDWQTTPITLTDVGTTTVWYRVATKEFGNIRHEVCLTVTPRDLSLVTVRSPEDQVWTGAALMPVPVVTDGEPSIITPADYVLGYADNVTVGTATVTVTGRGNYSGMMATTFAILPPPYDMSGIRFEDATFFADGSPKSLSITGTLPSGVTVSYTGNGCTVPGVYTVTAHFTGDANHQEIPDMTATLTLTEFVQARQLEPFSATLTELGVTPFGAKATVKAEGLPGGLKVVKTTAGWSVSGTPKETMDGVTRRAYVRITENRIQTLHLLRLCVLPATAEWTDTVGATVARELTGAASASGLPTGIRYKAGLCSGTPTKPGVFAVTVTEKDRSKRKFLWTIEPAVSPTCTIRIDPNLPQEKTRTMLRQGVAYAWPVSATVGASVSVTGVPNGLRLIKTPVKENGKIVRTDLSLGGVPTKVGEFVVTFKTKLGSVTAVTTEAFSVESLPAWAIGTFNGGGADGLVTLTASAVGKLSGKWMSGAQNWTLAAPSFATYDEAADSYTADLVMKSGKTLVTNAVTVTAGTLGGVVEGPLFSARQNLWKQEPWKAVGKAFARASAADYNPFGRVADSVAMKVAASGAVSVKGSFVIGENPRTGAPIRYNASGSSVLCPLATPDANGIFQAQVFVHFPPKPQKFPVGYTARITLYWVGNRFVVAEVEETLP